VNDIFRNSKTERVYFGRPAAEAVAEEAALTDATRVLLLTNQSLDREAKLIESIATALGWRHAGRLTSLKSQSPSSDVLAVMALARETYAHLLVAIGGGSVIDTVKVAVAGLVDGRKTVADLAELTPYNRVDQSAWPAAAKSAPRLVAVPTTLSSAEFSWGASFVDESINKKYALGHPLMAPQAVVLDPRATVTAPDDLLLGTGLKAIDHAAERLASHLSNPFSDACAAEALGLLDRALRRIKQDSTDLAARLDAQTGTWLSVAGQMSGVPVGASHPIGRTLSFIADVPHGATSAAIQPAVMRWNAPANAARQARIAAALGHSGASAADAIAALATAVGLPTRLRDLGVDRSCFAEVAKVSFEQGSIRTNPRPINAPQDIMEILELAW
jgi:maleylacetate reductase